MSSSVHQVEEQDEIDLGRLWARVIQNRWLVLVSVIVTTAAVSAYAFLARPMYRATAELMPASSERTISLGGMAASALGDLGSLAGGLGIGGSRNSRVEEALAVLRSRAFTEKFITDNNLLPQLFARKWNPTSRKWDASFLGPPTLAQGYDYFNKKIRTITPHSQTDIITLQIEWTNPTEAADWANELVDRLNTEMRSNAIEKADASLQFLRAQLKNTSTVEMRTAIGDLMEMELKKRMVAQVTPDYALQVVAAPVGSDGAKPVWPKKLLLISLAPVIGFIIGFLLTYLVSDNTPAGV